MAKKAYESEKIKAIAVKIREHTGTETKYTTEKMPGGVTEVYNTGYDNGVASINLDGEIETQDSLIDQIKAALVDKASGTDTSDADATAADITRDKVAYAKGVRLVGTAKTYQEAYNDGVGITNDADATSDDIIAKKKVWVKGEQVVGSVPISSFYTADAVATINLSSEKVRFKYTFDKRHCIEGQLNLECPLSSFGNATADHVVKGVRFTSAAGFLVDGNANTYDEGVADGHTAGYNEGYTAGLNETNDATATAADIIKDKTAWVGGEKLTGTYTTQGVINFKIDNTIYVSLGGLTWAQWCGSDANTDGYYVSGGEICQNYGSTTYWVCDAGGSPESANREIEANGGYITFIPE